VGGKKAVLVSWSSSRKSRQASASTAAGSRISIIGPTRVSFLNTAPSAGDNQVAVAITFRNCTRTSSVTGGLCPSETVTVTWAMMSLSQVNEVLAPWGLPSAVEGRAVALRVGPERPLVAEAVPSGSAAIAVRVTGAALVGEPILAGAHRGRLVARTAGAAVFTTAVGAAALRTAGVGAGVHRHPGVLLLGRLVLQLRRHRVG
jgi:hypothetical protein